MNMSYRIFSALMCAGLCCFAGCRSVPQNAEPVSRFDVTRYMGKWYEVARFDFSFEKNLNNTTAEYTLNADNSVKVVNRGFNALKRTWNEAVGKAKFRGEPSVAALKVSFFGPFYGEYNVIALTADYSCALVAGKNTDYLWILSRTPDMPQDTKASFLETARRAGFDTDRLVWVAHTAEKE